MNKVPHFLCRLCEGFSYTEGGYAAAGRHHKNMHLGERFNPRIDMLYPRDS